MTTTLALFFSISKAGKWALPLKKLSSINLSGLHFIMLDNLGEGANETRFEKHD